MSMIPPSVDIAQARGANAFGSECGVLIASWRGEVGADAVRDLIQYRDVVLGARFVGAIHMAEEGLQMPPTEVRAAARAGVEARRNMQRCIGLVIFGTGFGASAIRSLSTAIFAFRAGPPTRSFSDLKSAAGWLAPRAAMAPLDVGRLITACEVIRRAGL